jgi:hypothetical protein
MFGPGIPVLFPLGLLALINVYIVEKISVAYIYRKPANYSQKINKECVAFLRLAPILYTAFGFWFYSN